jgi:hypothetical protein
MQKDLMKYWKRFPLSHLEIIQEKALKFALADPKIFSGKIWIPVDRHAFNRAVPELNIALAKHRTYATYIAIIAVTKAEGTSVHIDEQGLQIQARLNIPLLNCEGSMTEFYTYPEKPLLRYSEGGVPYLQLEHQELCVKVDEVELNQPTVLRIAAPHRVACNSNLLPRLALTIKLSIDPVRWLT